MNSTDYFSKFFNGTKNPTLDTMYFFMEKLNHPEKKLKFIHVAGTNGKGSVVEMLSSILIDAGYKVGKFMSPLILSHHERFIINNTQITEKKLMELIDIIDPLVIEYNSTHQNKVSLFELVTAIAILYFSNSNCDIVLLEVGMGGLWDCTNIINPIASIITSIGMDHMNILGSTIEEIATQKAGIIKPNSNTIFFEHENKNVNKIIKDTCAKQNNNLILIKEKNISNYSYTAKNQIFDYKSSHNNEYKKVKINLKGKIQTHNASMVIEMIELLNTYGYKVFRRSIRKGIDHVIHKARFEIINKKPLIIYEGGHNEQAIRNFQKNMKMYYPNQSINIIFQALNTKDYKSILDILCENNWHIICTSGINKENDSHQYVDKEELYNYIKDKKGHHDKMELKDAIKSIDGKYDVNIILGSFYIYADAIKEVKKLNDRT